MATTMSEEPRFESKPQNPTAVYHALTTHQTTADEAQLKVDDEWSYHELTKFLVTWAGTFITRYRLEIPMPPFNVERLRAGTMGYYRDRNGYGLRGEIAINVRYLAMGKAELLDTLLHELLHLWQHRHGTPSPNNYHNLEFRKKAADVGLRIDAKGRSEGPATPPFTDLLAEHGIIVEPKFPQTILPKGHSKLKLWTCGCGHKARIAVKEVPWVCSRCRQNIWRVES